MYVCMCVYIYTHIHTYIHTYINNYIYIHIHNNSNNSNRCGFKAVEFMFPGDTTYAHSAEDIYLYT